MTRIMLKRLAARFDWPLTLGLGLLGLVLALGLLGRAFWHPELAYPATSLPNMPPLGFTDFRGIEGVPEHPLGTESSGRDMLALIIVGAPNTLLMALVAGLISTLIGVALGFFAGFSRGRLDGYIRLFTDVVMTIPPLLVLKSQRWRQNHLSTNYKTARWSPLPMVGAVAARNPFFALRCWLEKRARVAYTSALSRPS